MAELLMPQYIFPILCLGGGEREGDLNEPLFSRVEWTLDSGANCAKFREDTQSGPESKLLYCGLFVNYTPI